MTTPDRDLAGCPVTDDRAPGECGDLIAQRDAARAAVDVLDGQIRRAAARIHDLAARRRAAVPDRSTGRGAGKMIKVAASAGVVGVGEAALAGLDFPALCGAAPCSRREEPSPADYAVATTAHAVHCTRGMVVEGETIVICRPCYEQVFDRVLPMVCLCGASVTGRDLITIIEVLR